MYMHICICICIYEYTYMCKFIFIYHRADSSFFGSVRFQKATMRFDSSITYYCSVSTVRFLGAHRVFQFGCVGWFGSSSTIRGAHPGRIWGGTGGDPRGSGSAGSVIIFGSIQPIRFGPTSCSVRTVRF